MFKISYHRKEEVYMRPLVYKKPDWVTVYGDLKNDWFKTFFGGFWILSNLIIP